MVSSNSSIELHALRATALGLNKIGVFSFNLQDYALNLDETAQEILGVKGENCPTARELWSLFPEPYREELRTNSLQALHNKTIASVELPFPHPVRGNYWIRVIIQGIYDEEGVPIGKMGTMQDIHSLKNELNKLEEFAYRLEVSQKLALIGTWERDLIAQTNQFDEEFFEIIGLSDSTNRAAFLLLAEDNCEEMFYGLIHPEDKKWVIDEYESFFKTGISLDISHRVIINGKLKYIKSLVSLQMDRAGLPVKVIGTIQDVTDQKIFEADLIRTNRELTEAKETKSIFLSKISHELRTPLHIIQGFADLMRLEPDLGSKVLNYCNHITFATSNLSHMVEDLLDFAKLETGTYKLLYEWHDIRLIAKSHLGYIDALKKEKKIESKLLIDPNVPAMFYTDAKRVSQILNNLLVNAVKYTEEGFIMLSLSALADGGIRIEVSDSGEGIEGKWIDKIFDVFVQVNNAERPVLQRSRPEGFGLGLAITNHLVRLLGGSIKVESKPGQGSRFIVHLPRKEADHPVPDSDIDSSGIDKYKSENSWLRDVSILTVDDNPLNLSILNHWLLRWGAKVVSAHSGTQALNILQSESVDLMLIDLEMPEMNGFECWQAINNLPMHKPKGIACTADHVVDIQTKAKELGFEACLLKPHTQDQLLQAIKNACFQ